MHNRKDGHDLGNVAPRETGGRVNQITTNNTNNTNNINNKNGIQVFVRTLTGRTITLHPKPTDGVQGLMALLQEKEGVPEGRQLLVFGGRQLQPGGRTLADIGVRQGSVVELSLRLRGGGKGKSAGGGKRQKNKKRAARRDAESKRELEFREHNQQYAKVTKMLGNGRCNARCYDGSRKERLAIIRGAMRKRVWIREGDTVLVGLRDYQDAKCDIIAKYSDDDVRKLKALGELPQDAKVGGEATGGGEGSGGEEDLNWGFEFSDGTIDAI